MAYIKQTAVGYAQYGGYNVVGGNPFGLSANVQRLRASRNALRDIRQQWLNAIETRAKPLTVVGNLTKRENKIKRWKSINLVIVYP